MLNFSQAEERNESEADWDESVHDAFDAREIFDLIKEIRDPEHPMSLEELGYVYFLSIKNNSIKSGFIATY